MAIIIPSTMHLKSGSLLKYIKNDYALSRSWVYSAFGYSQKICGFKKKEDLIATATCTKSVGNYLIQSVSAIIPAFRYI